MSVLERIQQPRDLRVLHRDELVQLCAEIRDFTVESVRISVDTIVINYRTHWGGPVAEVLRFRDGLVVWGCGAYPPEDER